MRSNPKSNNSESLSYRLDSHVTPSSDDARILERRPIRSIQRARDCDDLSTGLAVASVADIDEDESTFPATTNEDSTPSSDPSQSVNTTESPTLVRSPLSPLSFRIRKRDILLCHILLIITSLITAIMNAAITIFGMGVGVGLILGDTLRSTTATAGSNRRVDPMPTGGHLHSNHTNYSQSDATTNRVVVVRPASAHCRATIRRPNVASASPSLSNNMGAHRMPAQ